MKFEAIELWRVRGNKDRITSETKLMGTLDLIPIPSGRAFLMLPVADLIATNAEHRKYGIMEIPPLSRLDINIRRILELTKAEFQQALLINAGDTLFISRQGWGKKWTHKIKKI